MAPSYDAFKSAFSSHFRMTTHAEHFFSSRFEPTKVLRCSLSHMTSLLHANTLSCDGQCVQTQSTPVALRAEELEELVRITQGSVSIVDLSRDGT